VGAAFVSRGDLTRTALRSHGWRGYRDVVGTKEVRWNFGQEHGRERRKDMAHPGGAFVTQNVNGMTRTEGFQVDHSNVYLVNEVYPIPYHLILGSNILSSGGRQNL
jgi:hypothetical protein